MALQQVVRSPWKKNKYVKLAAVPLTTNFSTLFWQKMLLLEFIFLSFGGLEIFIFKQHCSDNILSMKCTNYTPACEVNVLAGWKTQDVFLRGEAEAKTPGIVTNLKVGLKK